MARAGQLKILLSANYSASFISFRGQLVKDLVAAGHEVWVCLPDDCNGVRESLDRIGAKLVTIKMDRAGTNPWFDFLTIVRYLICFNRVSPDCLINYTVKPTIYGSFVGFLLRIPHVYSIISGLGYTFVGNNIHKQVLRKFVEALYRLALACNNKVFFLNDDDMELFVNRRIIASRRAIHLDGEGVCLSSFFYAAPKKGNICFLLIARMLRDKGVEEFVEAAKEVRELFPEVEFYLLGPLDENPSAISKEQLASWQEEGAIRYLGKTADVRPFIEQASVYVLPSYREGLPRTTIEAMAMGRPIVTTDVPGCRDTVVDGVNGFLVPARDSVALARAMMKFCADPELVVSMGQKSREIVCGKFDVRIINSKLLKHMQLTDEATF